VSKSVPGTLDGKTNPSAFGLVMDCSSVLIRKISFGLITFEKYIEYKNASDQFYVKLREFISMGR